MAIKQGIFIPRAHVFFDMAIPGCKERRPGFDQVRAVLKRGAAQVLMVFATNRLYRKLYKCLKLVEEEVVGCGRRAIFVKSHIDMADAARWRLLLQFHGLVDEISSSMYGEHIRAAHEGLFINGYVVCTLAYGYMGLDVPGLFTKRQRPRQLIVIDPETAEWVRTIFRWFVEDRLPMTRIVEQLNDLGAPLSPMSNGVNWTHSALRYLLENACYRGSWSYGKSQNIWQNAADYSKRVLREKPLKEKQFEDLRLISDEMWYKAQELLLSHFQRRGGRKPLDGNTTKRPRTLNGILFCKEHDVPLKIAGDHGQLLICTHCRCLPKEKRPIYSVLNRALALRLICRRLVEEIRKDKALLQDLIAPFMKEAQQLQQGETRGWTA